MKISKLPLSSLIANRQAAIDSFSIFAIYGSCALSLIDIKFFLLSLSLSLLLACRLNNMNPLSTFGYVFITYDSNNKFHQFVDVSATMLAYSAIIFAIAMPMLFDMEFYKACLNLSLASISILMLLFDRELR